MLDLFPEMLLVQRNGERIYTTSLKVAEHFRKPLRKKPRNRSSPLRQAKPCQR